MHEQLIFFRQRKIVIFNLLCECDIENRKIEKKKIFGFSAVLGIKLSIFNFMTHSV